MAKTTAAVMQAMSEEQRRPLQWLLIYSIQYYGGITQEWLDRTGLTRRQAEKLQLDFPLYRAEAEMSLHLGRLFSLDMFLRLLRERCIEMLASTTKPADLKTLLATFQGLPEYLNEDAGRSIPALQPATQEPELEVMEAADEELAEHAGTTHPASRRLPSLPDMAELQGMQAMQRQLLVRRFADKAGQLLKRDELPRQQRRQLERSLQKLKDAGML